jgi:hypothetical protein
MIDYLIVHNGYIMWYPQRASTNRSGKDCDRLLPRVRICFSGKRNRKAEGVEIGGKITTPALLYPYVSLCVRINVLFPCLSFLEYFSTMFCVQDLVLCLLGVSSGGSTVFFWCVKLKHIICCLQSSR